MKNPIQPIYKDENGILRFKENAIVRYLLDHGGIDLNDLGKIESQFSADDQEQFAQLIGYSLNGFAELPYVPTAAFQAAVAKSQDKSLSDEQARIMQTEKHLDQSKKALKEVVSLFQKIVDGI
jgi:hypothetical protein